ncbi:MAG: hypothetical protein A2275_05895 [Bacteroidetes bacterium RIFOXYA12_FULL_35_11]|nr:MAG: hypothetical protein A2X01_00185 [Bacteroidetes bacterium GWF2_35_48]OFY78883.1 MAG: hypothetical protein A2275_05895 [Bacteroidetes bacterium RIFOXYA12_FULL_35_11]OFY94440.1 MAG: hypothetical protein A2309_06310 [Bacteroidetes bacterium RIFOXYB2_FULL_35_7]OFZ04621.1 MAG: hypothetical protein A2491_11655 [Bacteroidetes bacterium RIFOXYC12_FULL_35_7]
MHQISLYFKRIIKLDELIRSEKTGTPSKLAKRFKISERSIFNYLKFMKDEMKSPIIWDDEKKSYVYSRKGVLNIGWVKNTPKKK